MGGLAAPAGEDALGRKEAVNVFRLGFDAGQDDLLPFIAQTLGPVGVEHHLADGRARRGGDAHGQRLMLEVRVDAAVQELLQHVRLDPEQGLLLGDQTFLDHIHRGLDQGPGVHLAVAGLEHVELALLDGELEVLDFPVVFFQDIVHPFQFFKDRGHVRAQFFQGPGGADARHHVFALGVDQIVAVEFIFAGARVPGEAHAGGAIVPHVAEDHGADVYRGAVGQIRGDVELAAVVHGPFAHPGLENALHGQEELGPGVLGKGFAGDALDDILKFLHHLRQGLRSEFGIHVGADTSL